ncbi:(acyl-carrier-protein) S-malonyltransferase [Fructilactobacillus fructivorans]|uniref:ACP S-malonyltransferase n=1 Tax=Fructilactobacillus fructivorans TaxID=1614 RepID=UPI00070562DD|nr:ACP S-malonyltransferase [Fructilactobacillus fructivorans]KRN12864.1 (acyl-carrier-protein) S-malonyltransferase [Fructilactobacillus fructivorans]
MKIGYLFSGQGQQFPGMGSDLYQNNDTYRNIVDTASRTLNLDLSDPKVFDDPENTQVAILTMSYGIYRILADQLPKAQAMVGLSLGEYSALVSAKALSFQSGLKLVRDRSHYMDEAGKQNPGSMAAVLKIDPDVVVDVTSKIDGAYPANFNTSEQTVIGGTKAGVEKASVILKERGAKRVVPLKVAVSSHTPLMQLASDLLAKRMENVAFKTPTIPVISNTDVDLFNENNLADTLTRQLVNPTHFREDLELMINNYGVDTLIEIGPGNTLTKFVKKTLKDVNAYSVDSLKKLTDLQEKLGLED